MKIVKVLKRKAAFAKYCQQYKIRKLQIGCGRNIIEGFFNTDVNILWGAHYLDATEPMPFEENTFDFIFSEHNHEHFTYHDGKLLLKECLRVLKPGGVIRPTMPCLEFLIDIYNHPEKKENQEYMKWHFEEYEPEQFEDFGEDFSAAFMVNNFMRMWFHQCVYDKNTIRRVLEICGFSDITFHNVSESDHEELRNIEHHQNIMPAKFNLMETICVEAIKPYLD